MAPYVHTKTLKPHYNCRSLMKCQQSPGCLWRIWLFTDANLQKLDRSSNTIEIGKCYFSKLWLYHSVLMNNGTDVDRIWDIILFIIFSINRLYQATLSLEFPIFSRMTIPFLIQLMAQTAGSTLVSHNIFLPLKYSEQIDTTEFVFSNFECRTVIYSFVYKRRCVYTSSSVTKTFD